MITLGIETSCDETALALIETRANDGIFECRVISSLVHSQAELHRPFGGVFPSLAKREHGKNLLPLLKKILDESTSAIYDSKNELLSDEQFSLRMNQFQSDFSARNSDLMTTFAKVEFLKTIPHIDRIAVTEGPGLEPALWVGIIFGQILSRLWSIPIVPVNHMEGHVVGSLLESDKHHGEWQKLKPLAFPAIALLISGGHTELVEIKTDKNSLGYNILGQTKDDAVGEAFDKVARLLGLPYPGGPHVSKLAGEAEEEKIVSIVKLPRPMLHSGDLNFSFSGLKTAVMYAVRNYEKENGKLDDNFKKGLAKEFEESVKITLDTKLRSAIENTGAKTIIVGGGVSANKTLRKAFENTAKEFDIPLYLPSNHISGDNALMIALAGSLDEKEYTASLRAQGTKSL